MSAPATKINNLVQGSNKVQIDSVSKYFIIFQAICGLFRLPVLGVTRKYFVILMFVSTVLYNVLITYFVYPMSDVYYLAQLFNFIEFLSCTFLGYFLHRRLILFYNEINIIDRDLCFKVSGRNFIKYGVYILQILTMGISLGVLFYLYSERKNVWFIYLCPMKLLHYLELNYYGHLFSLIIPRLKLLKGIINVCYNREKSTNDNHPDSDFGLLKKSQRNCKDYDVISLIDSYNNFIKAYDYLNSAIKWQMVIILIAIFMIGLNMLFYISNLFLYGDEFWNRSLILHLVFLILEFIPLMVPCFYANEICNEMAQLKEILTCRLYESRLDKDHRRAARALLDLIQTRPLYFSLLHMFDVDFTLPFKILGLILTYLIILLQFDKVINPNQVRDVTF